MSIIGPLNSADEIFAPYTQVRMAQAAMASRDTSVAELCRDLRIGQGTLYRYVDPSGALRENGRRVLER